MRHFALLLVAVVSSGCSLDSEGTSENPGVLDDTGTIGIDTEAPDTTPIDDTATDDTNAPDTTLVDSGVDTFVPDTNKPDTAMPDTAMPDTSVADTAPEASTCTGTVYGGHCYFLIDMMTRSWNASRDACTARGAHLVTIANNSELSAVNAIGTGERWIGLSRSGTTWDWVNSESSGYRNWDTGEPNGTGGCARMMSDGHWRDTGCSDAHLAICERDSL